MTNESDREPYAKLRTVVRWMWIAPVVVAIFVAWTLYSRSEEDRRIQQEAIEKKRAQDQRAVESLGGNRFEILQFYATAAIIRRGEAVQLCYGVSNAKTVRLEPQSNAVWPSFARCVSVSPTKDTAYTLTIEDGQGNTKSASLLVQVR